MKGKKKMSAGFKNSQPLFLRPIRLLILFF